jgi:hypothetical protein
MMKIAALLLGLASVATACETFNGSYVNEKGTFTLSWCFPTPTSIEFEASATGTAYIAIGFGGSMYDGDIIAGWVDSDDSVVIGDYFSTANEKPPSDESLGGTNDVVAIGGSKDAIHNSTTLRFSRELDTGDQYDTAILASGANDMIYAWASGAVPGLAYHGEDNHNHVMVDFSVPNGIPNTTFGKEESGELSRELAYSSFYGTLSTLQSEGAGNPAVKNYPYGSVADIADEVPSSGMPLLLLSDLERNVMNLAQDPRCSLHLWSTPQTVAQFKRPEWYDVMTKPRTTLLGKLQDTGSDQASQQAYLAKHPESKAWANFSDFTLYRFVVEDVYVVGGFGNNHYIGWVDAQQYLGVSMA